MKKINDMSNVIKRLDRIEECLEILADFFYKHKNYMQESYVEQSIEFAQGLTEKMYEERTGLDVITGEKLDIEKEDEKNQ